MKPLVRGTEYAASSMAPQASLAAEHVLRNGGNAFDAIVAGQAVLGVMLPALNGLGSDAELLVYDAKLKKVFSLNAEGTAPKLATIEWYKTNRDGKIPVNDSLLSATVPGVVDAWYILLSKWGTKTFGELLAPAIEIAERGAPIGGSLNSKVLSKYPTTARVFAPDGKIWKDGELWKNPDLARTLRRLVEAEKEASSKGRQAGLKAARDRLYKGDIAHEMADFSKENGGLFRYEDFATYSAKLEEPVSTTYRGYTVYKNASASQGPTELLALNILEGYDLKSMGLKFGRIYPHFSGSDEARYGRSRYLPGRHGFHQDPLLWSSLEGVRLRTPQADRSNSRFARVSPRRRVAFRTRL
jgi:gamma-glutamyltranspeptidase/glutathione hydrolase